MPRYITIAALDLIKCIPMSSFLIPRIFSPNDTTTARKLDTISSEVMFSIRPYFHTTKTNVLSVAPGYPLIHRMVAAYWQTGHKSTSPDAIYVTVSFLLSFSCHSKVTDIQFVYSSQGLLWFNSLPFLKKRTFLNQIIYILHFSTCGTSRYSQELIP